MCGTISRIKQLLQLFDIHMLIGCLKRQVVAAQEMKDALSWMGEGLWFLLGIPRS